MNLAAMMRRHGNTTVRYALTGAAGQYARTLIAQSRLTSQVSPAILCDLDVEAVHRLCLDVGFHEQELSICGSMESVGDAVSAGRIAIVAELSPGVAEHFDILVEATGSPGFGCRAAQTAIAAGRHVAMVSKEVDSVAGLALARAAEAAGVTYTPAAGDQPGNLLDLVGWVRVLGLEIVAVGKSSEYDLIFDHVSGRLSLLGESILVPELVNLWELDGDLVSGLARRAELVAPLTSAPAADYCEMAVVANHLGLTSGVEGMHYPVARIPELADVYARQEAGGLVRRNGIVDVFHALRRPDEASFAGGVFVVVRTSDSVSWEILAGKGHVVSRSGDYACIYRPYHFMGVETPAGLLAATMFGSQLETTPKMPTVVLAGRAQQDLPAGTVLEMGGHHHDVQGVAPVLVNTSEAPEDLAPLYLAAHSTLTRDVASGQLLLLSALDGADSTLISAWDASRKGE